MIIYDDEYECDTLNPKTGKWDSTQTYYDRFIIHKKEGSDEIYYKDVIDYLISVDFVRNDCDHRFLETIRGNTNKFHRNKHSVEHYCSFWGVKVN